VFGVLMKYSFARSEVGIRISFWSGRALAYYLGMCMFPARKIGVLIELFELVSRLAMHVGSHGLSFEFFVQVLGSHLHRLIFLYFGCIHLGPFL
jgi:hypothetical protein